MADWPISHVEAAALLNGHATPRWVRERLRRLGRGLRVGKRVLLWESDFAALITDVAHPAISGRREQPQRTAGAHGRSPTEPRRLRDAGGVGDAGTPGLSPCERALVSGAVEDDEGRAVEQPSRSPWAAADWLPCIDGKARPVEPGIQPLAHGIPGRVGRLRAAGNAIVPQIAAEFVMACEILTNPAQPAHSQADLLATSTASPQQRPAFVMRGSGVRSRPAAPGKPTEKIDECG